MARSSDVPTPGIRGSKLSKVLSVARMVIVCLGLIGVGSGGALAMGGHGGSGHASGGGHGGGGHSGASSGGHNGGRHSRAWGGGHAGVWGGGRHEGPASGYATGGHRGAYRPVPHLRGGYRGLHGGYPGYYGRHAYPFHALGHGTYWYAWPSWYSWYPYASLPFLYYGYGHGYGVGVCDGPWYYDPASRSWHHWPAFCAD